MKPEIFVYKFVYDLKVANMFISLLSIVMIFPILQIVCSNAGVCECGRCKCKKGYIGMYCENCIVGL